jgi:hypothetical protein
MEFKTSKSSNKNMEQILKPKSAFVLALLLSFSLSVNVYGFNEQKTRSGFPESKFVNGFSEQSQSTSNESESELRGGLDPGGPPSDDDRTGAPISDAAGIMLALATIYGICIFKKGCKFPLRKI